MNSTNNETSSILHWLCRDYESVEFWKEEARKSYLETVVHPNGNANSRKAITLFSKKMQLFLLQFMPETSLASVWEDENDLANDEDIIKKTPSGSASVILKRVPVPDYRSANIDWEEIADYFLLAASVSWPEFENINSQRSSFNESVSSRESANENRVLNDKEAICKYLEEWSQMHLSTGSLLPIGCPECPQKDKWTMSKIGQRKTPRTMFSLLKLSKSEGDKNPSLTLPMITLYQPIRSSRTNS